MHSRRFATDARACLRTRWPGRGSTRGSATLGSLPQIFGILLHVLDVGAPKRPHHALAADSSTPLRLVLLSRLVRSKDEATLEALR